MAPLDAQEGLRRKQEGMSRAADAKPSLLDYSRSLARQIALRAPDRTVTADDVAAKLEEQGLGPLGRAAGSLFRGEEWEFTGRYIESAQPQNHRHPIKIWRLR